MNYHHLVFNSKHARQPSKQCGADYLLVGIRFGDSMKLLTGPVNPHRGIIPPVPLEA